MNRLKGDWGEMTDRRSVVVTLVDDPPLLLCDEPTVGVDPQSRNAIFEYLQLLNKQGKTIVYTTHYMEEVERLCSRIAIIDAGKLIAGGTLDELLEKLAVEDSISIIKNRITSENMYLFKQFGVLTDEQERYELSPGDSFRLSNFFAAVEQNGI